MPNYSLVSQNQIKPISFEEMMAPYIMYGQEYTRQEEALNNLAVNSNMWDTILKEEENPTARGLYDSFSQGLNNQLNALTSGGLSPEGRRALISLNGEYSRNIKPIEIAYQKAEMLAKEVRDTRIKDPTYITANDNVTIDDLLKDPNANYGKAMYGSGVLKQAETMFSSLKDETKNAILNIIKQTNGTFEQFFAKIQKDKGYRSEDLNKFLNGENIDGYQVLNTILKQAAIDLYRLDTWDVDEDRKEELIDQSVRYAAMGIWKAVGDMEISYTPLHDNREGGSKNEEITVDPATEVTNESVQGFSDRKIVSDNYYNAAGRASSGQPYPFIPVENEDGTTTIKNQAIVDAEIGLEKSKDWIDKNIPNPTNGTKQDVANAITEYLEVKQSIQPLAYSMHNMDPNSEEYKAKYKELVDACNKASGMSTKLHDMGIPEAHFGAKALIYKNPSSTTADEVYSLEEALEKAKTDPSILKDLHVDLLRFNNAEKDTIEKFRTKVYPYTSVINRNTKELQNYAEHHALFGEDMVSQVKNGEVYDLANLKGNIITYNPESEDGMKTIDSQIIRAHQMNTSMQNVRQLDDTGNIKAIDKKTFNKIKSDDWIKNAHAGIRVNYGTGEVEFVLVNGTDTYILSDTTKQMQTATRNLKGLIELHDFTSDNFLKETKKEGKYLQVSQEEMKDLNSIVNLNTFLNKSSEIVDKNGHNVKIETILRPSKDERYRVVTLTDMNGTIINALVELGANKDENGEITTSYKVVAIGNSNDLFGDAIGKQVRAAVSNAYEYQKAMYDL